MEYTKQFSVVFLRTADDVQEMKLRAELTRDLIVDKAKRIVEVFPEGSSLLAKMLSVMYVVDVASIYLAVLNGVDPMAMLSITKLKAQLSDRTKVIDRVENEVAVILD